MKKNLCVCLMLLSSLAYGQDCTQFVGTKDEGFRAFIRLNDAQSQLAMEITALTHDKYIAVALLANKPQLCPDKGDTIAFEFTSGVKHFARNDFGTNCEQRYALYFNGIATSSLFDSLASQNLKTISLHHQGQVVQGFLKSKEAEEFKNSLKCLSDCLRYDSVAQQVRQHRDSLIFTIVESMPEFTGGYEAMYNYIKQSIQPKGKDSGTVYVHFVIEKDGSITDAKVIRGVSPKSDAEALRVVASMPKWKAGTQNGKPVRVSYVLPVKFK